MNASGVPESQMGEAGRLVGIFWEPKPVFQDLAERPRFWVPLILLTLISTVFIIAFSNRVGYESVIRRQMESNTRVQEMSAEQQEQARIGPAQETQARSGQTGEQ